MNTGLSEKHRQEIAEALSKVLADSYLVYLKMHNFHWNVTGPMFQTLHIMFMEQYTELWNALDLIAERIRALGHYAPGSYKRYTELSSIQEEENVPKAHTMIQQLISDQETLIRNIRQAFIVANDANDQSSADLLTQRLDIHEKNAWMLRSLMDQ
jgi:starvation-inducible DNA-binding protein